MTTKAVRDDIRYLIREIRFCQRDQKRWQDSDPWSFDRGALERERKLRQELEESLYWRNEVQS